MKRLNLSVLLVLIFWSATSIAQVNKPSNYKSSGHDNADQLIHYLLSKSGSATAAKTTATTQTRLIAESQYNLRPDPLTGYTSYGFGIADSGRYYYSGARTSHFDYNTMGYSHRCIVDGTTPFGFKKITGTVLLNPLVDLEFDKALVWGNNNTLFMSPYILLDTLTASYNADNTIGDFSDFYIPGYLSGMWHFNTYNSDSNVTSTISLLENNTGFSSTWDSFQHRQHTYDITKKLISDSTFYHSSGTWSLLYKNTYTYDALNNIVQIRDFYNNGVSWDENQRYDFTYYPGGKLQKITLYSDAGGVLALDRIDSFGWTGSLNYVTFADQRRFNLYTGIWDYQSTSTKHISPTTMLPDGMYSLSKNQGGYIYNFQTFFSYNSDLQPVLAESYLYDSSTGTFDSVWDVAHYYYEPYSNTGVEHTALNAATQMTIYPNPANTNVTILLNAVPENTPVHLRLFNSLGQAVMNKDVQWQTSGEDLSLAHLPPGIYYLVAENRSTNEVYKQAVVKQ